MKFNVKRTHTYALYDDSIKEFKERMLRYLENEMEEDGELNEGEKFPYTIADISDDIVYEALADTVQIVFADGDFGYSGIQFDDYFDTISLDFDEDDVRECVYEAVANFRDEMEGN